MCNQQVINQTAAQRVDIFPGRGRNIGWAGLWRNFLARNRVRDMRKFSDERLYDIGVTRDELRWAAKLPLSVNAALALNERAHRRRRAERMAGRII